MSAKAQTGVPQKPLFQKRHYEAIAKVLNLDPYTVPAALADMFKKDNPNFDREKFLDACRKG